MAQTRQQRHDYYMKNRERLIAAATARARSRPQEKRAYMRSYEAAHPQRRTFARHAMRPAEWARMFAEQHGRCYLCGDPLSDDRRNTHVEHDHSCCPSGTSCSYCRRGLACNACNHLIGLAADDPDRLRRIADNLETALMLARERIKGKPAQDSLFDAEKCG